jgi:glycine reductase
MKLQLEAVKINSVEFSTKTGVSDHVLSINRRELKKFLEEDEHFASVNIELAKPGDPTRIVNVVDVAEPRGKITGGVDFPGVLGEIVSAGKGVTRALKGIVAVFCDRHPHWVHSKSIIDMSGPGAEMGRYGKMLNVVIDPTPNGEIPDFEYAHSVKVAGFKASAYLARAAADAQVDEVEVFEMETTKNENSHLPRIAYYYQIYSPQHDSRGIPDPIFYGHPISTTLPLVVHPNEILDGAALSGYTIRMMESYSIQNHPVILELYRRHGKEVNFAGLVLGVSSMESARHPLVATMVGNLLRDTLGADGVIMTKALGGAPTVDLGEAAVECEKRGVKTCLLVQILNTETDLASEAMFSAPSLNAIVNTGVIFDKVALPVLPKILGGTTETPVFHDIRRQTAGQELEVEQRFICGSLNQLGTSHATAVQY